ncbi:MAG: hypothetical protein QXG90_04670 [Candidatus Nezhaarchaeales archaeon]
MSEVKKPMIRRIIGIRSNKYSLTLIVLPQLHFLLASAIPLKLDTTLVFRVALKKYCP